MVDSIAKEKAKETKGDITSQENSEISKTAIYTRSLGNSYGNKENIKTKRETSW